MHVFDLQNSNLGCLFTEALIMISSGIDFLLPLSDVLYLTFFLCAKLWTWHAERWYTLEWP